MIKFGTDGWRGVISEDYTFANVRLVAQAIADYINERNEADKGIVIGYDARFLSGRYAEECAAILAENGVKAWLSEQLLPTPALTWQVKDREAAGGVMITASHNPPEYNGLKFKASYGGSASPEIVQGIEKHVQRLEQNHCVVEKASATDFERFEPAKPYLDHVRAMLDNELLSSYRGKIVFDMMHGSASGYPSALAKEYGLSLTEICNDFNPSFGGISPEPIAKNLEALRQAVRETGAQVGLATDGDGDRIGAMDADGRYINALQIMAILIKYLVEKRRWTGGVVETLTISELIRRVADKYHLPVYETPVGFKYVAELMLTEDILIGGEEAGGLGVKGYIPERDGLLLGFLLIEACAAFGQTLGQILDDLSAEIGSLYYDRRDLHLEEAQKQKLLNQLQNHPPKQIGPFPVQQYHCGDGCKLTLPQGWVIFRVSGTEPLVRVYAEADDQDYLYQVLDAAQEYARG